AHGDELARVVRLMLDELGDRALLRHWSAVTPDAATGSPTHLLEVFHPQVNKWTMIERVAADHGIAPARIAAIGDEINDVEMIRHAGLGIAMANAAAPIRAMAARVTASHVEDGVALAVERILTGEW
ncbi:MAG: HAD hydrolase family protein, partial [Phycisphaerales bacterium]|nr:HAD hydrolase family protein [Phycisphaerales bacterium]